MVPLVLVLVLQMLLLLLLLVMVLYELRMLLHTSNCDANMEDSISCVFLFLSRSLARSLHFPRCCYKIRRQTNRRNRVMPNVVECMFPLISVAFHLSIIQSFTMKRTVLTYSMLVLSFAHKKYGVSISVWFFFQHFFVSCFG